jgi:hypothetical protein
MMADIDERAAGGSFILADYSTHGILSLSRCPKGVILSAAEGMT